VTNSNEFSSVLEQIGVKKGKKVDKLLPFILEVSSAISANDDAATLSALHKASRAIRSAFLVGGETKYKQFLATVSMNTRVTELLGNVGILESHLEMSNYDYKELTSSFFENFVQFILVSDDLISDGTGCFRLSPRTECAVVTEGSNTKQEIYAGQTFDGGFSLLVGKWASTRTVGKDGRRAFFVAIDNNWEISIPLNPEETAGAQKMALRVKRRVEALAAESPKAKSEATDVTVTEDITSQLMRLSDMRQAGALTEDEWIAAKKRVLG
jgi:hypothetical protein